MTLQKEITTGRKRKGLTQRELADILKVSGQQISAWERGALPVERTLIPLCKTLGLDQKKIVRQYLTTRFKHLLK